MYRKKLFKMLSFSYIFNIFKNHRNRKGRSFSTVSPFFIPNGTSNQLIQKIVSLNFKKGTIVVCNCIDALLRRLHYMMIDIFTIFSYLQKRQTYNPAQSPSLILYIGLCRHSFGCSYRFYYKFLLNNEVYEKILFLIGY